MLSPEPRRLKDSSQALLGATSSVLDGTRWAEAKGMMSTSPRRISPSLQNKPEALGPWEKAGAVRRYHSSPRLEV